jgi:aspartate/methionine/tyrosine aminotransferase
MPRFPHITASVDQIQGSVFSSVAGILSRHEGELFRFQVGDTWMEPPSPCRMQDLNVEENPGMHRYTLTRGVPELVAAVADRVTHRSGLATTPEEILITAGATGGLAAVCGTILSPRDEVLVLAPYWPLVDGVIRANRGVPVAVPFIGVASCPEEAVRAVEAAWTPQTAALYISTPNNPTGRLIPGDQLAALADWARSKELWLISDEVYEDYAYENVHEYLRPLAPERTFSVHSFSKAFGMAGNRCGYVAGPEEVVGKLERITTHTWYSTTTASQLAVLEALKGPGDRWVAAAAEQYRGTGYKAADILGVDRPHGSTFLFVDAASRLKKSGQDLQALMIDLARHGIAVAPGPSFGPYPSHFRVCFTADRPDKVLRGMETLASLLE